MFQRAQKLVNYFKIKPKKKLEIIKIPTKKYVTLFNPFSVDFCDENNWLAAPIDAIPSPFGECNNTSKMAKIAETICNV